MSLVDHSRHFVRAAAALALGALALVAQPAAAQLTTIGDGSSHPSGPLCPGGSAKVNTFTLVSTGAGERVTRVQVRLSPPGAYASVRSLEIRNDSTDALYGSQLVSGDLVDVMLATTISVPLSPATPVQIKLVVVAKPHGEMPPSPAGTSIIVGANLYQVFAKYSRSNQDVTTGYATLDNLAPAELRWSNVASPNATTINLSWSNPADAARVLLLRKVGGPITDAPTEGQDPASFTQSTIRFQGLATSFSDTVGISPGKPHYYRAFVKDGCGNWSEGGSLGPIFPNNAVAEGDRTPNSLKPTVGIINPIPGTVTSGASGFRAQVRVASPKLANGTAQPVTVTMTAEDGAAFTKSWTLARNPNYGGTAESGVWEPSPLGTSLHLDPGVYTVRATASNGSGSVNSGQIGLRVTAGKGDGNLLVRDNSSQLCNDCHALQTHSSEATGSARGSFYVGCRACHAPHGTPNASLVANEITPPSVNGQWPPTKVVFSTRTGFDPAAGATDAVTMSAGTFANGDRTGPCQVCHTQTAFYLRADPSLAWTGGPGGHYTTRCTECHSHLAGFGASCTSCHGDSNRNGITGADALVDAAPPKDHLFNTVKTAMGVGAHEAHVNKATLRGAPIQCSECHTLPNSHDGSVQITWGSLATNSANWDSTPVTPDPWQRATGTCTNLYCHGNFRGGNASAQPSWTSPGSVICGSCHALPPSSTHTGSPVTCDGCHAGYSLSSVNAQVHMNGQLEAAGCDGCHGDPGRTPATGVLAERATPMPPKDSLLNTLTTARGVGAHENHANSNASMALPIACEECHGTFPTEISHKNGSTPMIWGALATKGGAAASWNGTTCANYCHGNTAVLGGAVGKTTPAWTTVNGSFKTCNSCHGLPPPVATTSHPQNTACSACHPGYNPATVTVARATHIDGTNDHSPATGCAQCHGKLGTAAVATTSIDAAPGVNTNVDSKNTAPAQTAVAGVGAHKAHLQTRWYRDPVGGTQMVACVECHSAVAAGDKTHANGVASAPFPAGTLSRTVLPGDTITANPGYATNQCSNTYCHGRFTGGTSAAPTWAAAGLVGTSMACTSCHGNPPTAAPAGRAHVNNTNCANANCHAGYSNATVNLSVHLNGVVEYGTLTCSTCHGLSGRGSVANVPDDVQQKASPPADTTGSSATSTLHVGAHQDHVNKTTSKPAACTECHNTEVPTATGFLHANGTTRIDSAHFGTLAKTGGVTPTYAAGTCSATYCHGNFEGGNGSAATPLWTNVTALGCAACHGNPPAPSTGTPKSYHPANATCANCHSGYTNASTQQITHVNGTVNRIATTGCAQCHGKLGTNGVVNTSTDAAPGVAVGSFDADGNPSSASLTALGVGAHKAHLVTGGLKATALICDNCHTVYTDKTHADGAASFSWTELAVSGGRTAPGYAAGTCSANYCHAGPSTWDATYTGSETSPSWIAGTKATVCGSCHRVAPSGGTHLNPETRNCGNCHNSLYVCTSTAQGPVGTCTVGPSNPDHMNGHNDLPNMTCASCHGSTTSHPSVAGADSLQNFAPPNDTKGLSSGGSRIGAHLSHVNTAVTTSPPIRCDQCHRTEIPAPTNMTHANGTTTIDPTHFGTLAKSGLTAPTYVSQNCSNTYCHGNFQGGKNAAIAWTGVAVNCASCHGNPPVPAAAAGSVPVSYHPANTTCQNCHGAGYTYASATTGTVVATTHVTGTVERIATTGCAQCHGKLGTNAVAGASTDAAPGVAVGSFDADGNPSSANRTALGVGAHKAHLVAGGLKSTALACSDCHPAHPDRTHANNTPEWLWGALATSRGRAPGSIGYSAGTCTNTYCHLGPSSWDASYLGSETSPSWTAGPGATVCGSCHKIAPTGGSHGNPETQNCKVCHGDPYDCLASNPGACTVGANNAMHMNGAQDVPNSTCSGCHGTTGVDVPDFVIGNATPSKLNTSPECTSFGHGNTSATFNEFTGAAPNERCEYCHDPAPAQHKVATNPYRLRGAVNSTGTVFGAYSALSAKNGNEVCLNCHDVSATVAYGVDPDGAGTLPRVCQISGANPCDTKATTWHAGTDHTATDGGRRCWDCHDPHGDLTNIKMIGKDLLVSSSDDHGFVGTRTLVDVVFTATTAASNYANTSTRNGVCQACHTQTAYWRQTSEPTAHHASVRCGSCHDHDFATPADFTDAFKGTGDCTVCHASAQTMAVAINGSTTRRPIVPEFQRTWSHKRSAAGAVTNADCTVCHMEGTPATGLVASPSHADGYIDLRDPDSGTTIMEVAWSGTNAPGAYANKAGPVASRFNRFSRNRTSNVLEEPVKAIMINQCLKCHDSNGAGSPNARVPTTGTAGKPFGTTITTTGYYQGGNGLTACGAGTNGCVTNIDASFNTTNASYHPVKGKQNNSFAGNATLLAPWNTLPTNKTQGVINTTTSWGFLISCWDCHAAPTDPNLLTSTVTAHGGAATVRGNLWASGTTAATNLCRACHFPTTLTSNHPAGSAATTHDSNPNSYMGRQCFYCHLSSTTRPARPIPAQDYHGFDTFSVTQGTDKMWPVGTAESYKPYAFMRNVGTAAGAPGNWQGTGVYWRPRTAPGSTGAASCGGNVLQNSNCSGRSHNSYGPGGVY